MEDVFSIYVYTQPDTRPTASGERVERDGDARLNHWHISGVEAVDPVMLPSKQLIEH